MPPAPDGLAPVPLGHSVERFTKSGRTRRFPGLHDFAEAFAQAGYIDGPDELLARRRDLLPDVFHTWVNRGQVACQFAMNLAKHRRQAGWVEVVQLTRDHPGAWLEPVLEAAADRAEAVLVVLPDIVSLDDFAGFVATLCELPRWTWEPITADGDSDAGHVDVGLRWRTPEGLPSWVLAFGDFEGVPFTRRSPVPALTLRTRGPANKYGAVDLARMKTFRDDEGNRRDDEMTRRNKDDLLNDELLEVARARVTLRLPRRLVDALPAAGA